MELQYFGGNCIKITTKHGSVVCDDNLIELGAKSITKPDDILLVTSQNISSANSKLKLDMPGEYEVSGISIKGIAARAHLDAEGKNSTIFKVIAGDISVGLVGHIYPELNEDQLEQLGQTDVLIVPVGGNGYTLDGIGALKIIRKIEPRIVVPVHYSSQGLNYPGPQASLEDALKSISMEPADTVDKLKLKPADIPEVTQLIVINKQ